MMKFALILIFCTSLISCNNGSNNSIVSSNSTNNEKHNDITINPSKEDSLREDYSGFDTLFIGEYLTDDGNDIKLEGSKSNDVYRIVVKNHKGITRKFQIADIWYLAAHSSILWDNNKFIFVRYGCGASCWGAKVLCLNDSRGILDFQYYIYSDSINNIIAYPDTVDWDGIVIENFDKQKRMPVNLGFCGKSADPVLMIDTIYADNKNNIIIFYEGKNCQRIKKVVNIGRLKN